MNKISLTPEGPKPGTCQCYGELLGHRFKIDFGEKFCFNIEKRHCMRETLLTVLQTMGHVSYRVMKPFPYLSLAYFFKGMYKDENDGEMKERFKVTRGPSTYGWHHIPGCSMPP